MAENIEVAGLVTKIAIDDSLINASMNELDRKMKLIKSEFDKASSGLQNFGKGAEGLSIKADSLNKQLEVQGQRLAKLNEQYQKSVEGKGKDAVATQNLEIKLNKAVAEYNKLDAELKKTTKELEIQSSAWTKVGSALDLAGNKMQDVGKKMEGAGRTASAYVTAPLVAVGGLATKAAIDFESAFAGVRKTVDATEEEFASLSQGIRTMTKEVPVAATEIAKVAEAAGQLGIKKESIMGFTRTMIDLGVATNLTGDQAATSLARLANITQMPQENFDRLGATIVALGNNLATTESEIVEMGLRLAGAGKTIGLTEAQVLALAGSLSSVGIEAEAGGSAMSKVMVNIASEVATGGKKLEGFAALAGMTVDQFRKSFQEDAAGAIISFVEGLGRIQQTGGNVFGVLEDLGITEVRMRDALLRASNAGDLFRESLELGSRAWKENTALTKEAEQRYETTTSKLQILKNRMVDAGITLGDALIPAFTDAFIAMEPLFRSIEQGAIWFANLDSGTQKTIITMAGLAAAAGPTLIVTGKLVTSVGAITTAFGTASTAMATAGGAAAVLSKGIAVLTGPIGIVVSGLTAITVAGIALNKHLSQDSIPAVQNFGEQASAAAQRASGSFAKFRQETQTNLQEASASAEKEGEQIGKGVASGITKGTKEAKKQAVDDMKEMVEQMKETVDRSTSSLSRLGDGIANALKKQYDEMEKIQTKALERQVDEERKASDERMKIYDREYTEKLKLIDIETYNQVKAIQDQIDAVDGLTKSEDKAQREKDYRERIAEYQRQQSLATTAEEREKIQKDITKTTADFERQQLLESRQVQKESLREQIEAVKAAANEKKDALKRELEDQKQVEKEKLEVTLKSLSDEKDAVKAHFAELTKAENLQAETRKMIVEQNNDEIIRLLETYNPKWQDTGQSLADSFAKGLRSEGQSMTDAIAEALNIAPVIDNQVAELDRMQKKLKELEKTAKDSDGSFDFGFRQSAEEAEEFRGVLLEELQPSIEDLGKTTQDFGAESLKAFIGLNHDATVEFNKLKWSGEQVTEETATSIADKFYAMGNTILGNLESSHADRLQSMQRFFADSTVLTEEEEAESMRKLQESLNGEASTVETGMKRVAEILSNALDEKRGIKQEEYDEILRIQSEMVRDAEIVLGKHELEQKTLLERMRADAGIISAKQASEVVMKSKEQRDGAIQAAEEQYEKSIEQIIRMRDEAKVISADQASALIADAKKQRDESVRLAQDMHQNVLREAKKLAGDFVYNIDWATGEVLSKWDAFKNKWGNKVIELQTSISKWSIEIGKSIADGIGGGIERSWEGVKKLMGFAAKDVQDSFANPLEIRSPSRVMMRLGEFTGEGLTIGLQNSLVDIKRQAAAMAKAAIPGMQDIQMPHVAAMSGPVGSAAGAGASYSFNFDGMFAGANFNVRSDEDVHRLALDLAEIILSKGRG